MTNQKTYNVTNLTTSEREILLEICMNQKGFTAIIKNKTNNQTHYTFQYINYDFPHCPSK